MVQQKLAKETKTLLYLIVAFLFQIAAYGLFPQGVGIWALVINALLIVSVYVGQFFLEYRIRKGVYGDNAYEALEIARFVSDHCNKDDFMGDGKNKRVFQEPQRTNATIPGGAGVVR